MDFGSLLSPESLKDRLGVGVKDLVPFPEEPFYSPIQLEADATLALMTDIKSSEARILQKAAIERMKAAVMDKRLPEGIRVRAQSILHLVQERLLMSDTEFKEAHPSRFRKGSVKN